MNGGFVPKTNLNPFKDSDSDLRSKPFKDSVSMLNPKDSVKSRGIPLFIPYHQFFTCNRYVSIKLKRVKRTGGHPISAHIKHITIEIIFINNIKGNRCQILYVTPCS